MAVTPDDASMQRSVPASGADQETNGPQMMDATPADAWTTVAGPVPSDYVQTTRCVIVMVDRSSVMHCHLDAVSVSSQKSQMAVTPAHA